MADQTTTGASNAADFQPPTDNPQSGVGGGVQPTTTNGSNVFNQPGINPQAFPKTESLHVVTSSSQALAGATSSDVTSSSPSWGTFTIVFIVAVLLLGGLVIMLRTAKPPGKEPETVPEAILETATLKPVKTKPKKKPSTNRRKKHTKKRNRK